MDKGIDRCVLCDAALESGECQDCGQDMLQGHIRFLQARVAELEKENEKYRSAFRTIQERRGKKFGGAPADFVVFDEYGSY